MPGPRTGAHRRPAGRPVSALRGFPPVLPVPRAAGDDVVASLATTVLPELAPVEAPAPVVEAPAPVVEAPAPVVEAAPVRRRSLRDRRPHLLLAALVAGAIGAGVLGVPGSTQAGAEPSSELGVQMELATEDVSEELLPMASITEAEAQARLQEVAASRAERAAAEAAAAEAAAEAARPKAVLPVSGARFTSGFGSRWGTFHYGIDLAAPLGTPEYAAADGVVLRAGAASGFGLAVYVLHDNGDVTVYGHMQEILVEVGQFVEAGETIALLGNRGQSTGPHLHFEVHQGGMSGRKVDPVPWLAARGVEV
ncbi:Murein DD-endopeptidase MepM and murein hydrolase activator NlpD, contain LysM domain [Geodermatophilus amargosae]|uniref:Murein DD-endopeptidase MepM and murein hydrolase activator NlpD, contain LysM domain n=1 Tax=Geodermatophilus amargosae TaxID=1296565 RepID=A0A1I7CC73_9ACTN|nr:Murein DD-endopeptidase MepM and murein hydrolase activator NlpD, contain LysM domain [Geodermatophilus amargosae]